MGFRRIFPFLLVVFVAYEILPTEAGVQVEISTPINGTGEDSLTMGPIKKELNEVLSHCVRFLPMVESYMKLQSRNPQFLQGGTDEITLQTAMDLGFNSCENILDVIAAFELVIQDSQHN